MTNESDEKMEHLVPPPKRTIREDSPVMLSKPLKVVTSESIQQFDNHLKEQEKKDEEDELYDIQCEGMSIRQEEETTYIEIKGEKMDETCDSGVELVYRSQQILGDISDMAPGVPTQPSERDQTMPLAVTSPSLQYFQQKPS